MPRSNVSGPSALFSFTCTDCPWPVESGDGCPVSREMDQPSIDPSTSTRAGTKSRSSAEPASTSALMNVDRLEICGARAARPCSPPSTCRSAGEHGLLQLATPRLLICDHVNYGGNQGVEAMRTRIAPVLAAPG